MQLDVLAGNIYVGKVEGQILVNGSVIQPKMMQQISCYVMQNPALLSSATVSCLIAVSMFFFSSSRTRNTSHKS